MHCLYIRTITVISDKYEEITEVFSACAGAAIYRKGIFEKIGMFDETHFAYLEDLDVGYRAKIYGYRNFYAPKSVVYHAGSASSGSRHNAFKVNLSSKNSVYVIYKNMPFVQLAINFPALAVGVAVKSRFFKKNLLTKYPIICILTECFGEKVNMDD